MRRSTAAKLILFLIGAALVGCASVRKLPEAGPCSRVYVFWPTAHGNHTDLLIRREDFPVDAVFARPAEKGKLRPLVAEEHANLTPGTEWIEVGFSNAEHLNALQNGGKFSFWKILEKTPAALTVGPFLWGGDPANWKTTGENLRPIDLPAAGYRELLDFVAASFAKESTGAVPPPFLFLPGTASAYLAAQPYSFRMFCNVWALGALRAAGVPLSSWMPGQNQVRYWLDMSYHPPLSCAEKPAIKN